MFAFLICHVDRPTIRSGLHKYNGNSHPVVTDSRDFYERRCQIKIKLLLTVLLVVLLLSAVWSSYSIGYCDGAARILTDGSLKEASLALIPSRYLKPPSYITVFDATRPETTADLLKKLIKQEQERYDHLSQVLNLPSSQ